MKRTRISVDLCVSAARSGVHHQFFLFFVLFLFGGGLRSMGLIFFNPGVLAVWADAKTIA